MIDGPGPGIVSNFNSASRKEGALDLTQDSKSLNGYALSIKGAQTRTTTAKSKKSAETKIDRFSAGTRVMRRQQSLSNIDELNSFVDFNNGLAPVDQNGNGALPNSGGSMFGSGGRRAFGIESGERPEAPAGNSRSDEAMQKTSDAEGLGMQLADLPEVESSLNEKRKGRLSGQLFDGDTGTAATSKWNKVGGLSLPIDIPTGEQSLTFSRVGGEAKLALRIRSRELADTGVGFVWTLVWLGIAATLIVTFSRVSTPRELLHPAVWILFVGGLLSFLILPSGLSALGFVGFLVGLLALVLRFVRAGRTA